MPEIHQKTAKNNIFKDLARYHAYFNLCNSINSHLALDFKAEYADFYRGSMLERLIILFDACESSKEQVQKVIYHNMPCLGSSFEAEFTKILNQIDNNIQEISKFITNSPINSQHGSEVDSDSSEDAPIKKAPKRKNVTPNNSNGPNKFSLLNLEE